MTNHSETARGARPLTGTRTSAGQHAVIKASSPPPFDGRALSGFRICDLSGLLAGAGATRLLAVFGADVIRVEDPVRQGRWDGLRGQAPFVDERRGINLGGAFNNHNVEKRGVTLNLKHPRGQEAFRRLVVASDVVTENFAAGVMQRLGFSYPELRRLRDDIIYVSNCGFGQTGPYRDYKSFGPVMQAMSGLTMASGLPGEEPAGWGYSYMDHHGGYFMALAILGALVDRERTGNGQWIDLACVEMAWNLMGPAVLDFTVNGRRTDPDRRNSNRCPHGSMAPHGIYPARGGDDWVAVACRDDDDWCRLAAVIGAPWAAEERFRELAGRVHHEDELDELVASWTSTAYSHQTARTLTTAGVPASVVARPRDRVDNNADNARWGLWPVADHQELGQVRVDGVPLHLSDTDWSIRDGAPCLGQHNAEVLTGLLGYTTDEVDEMRSCGAI